MTAVSRTIAVIGLSLAMGAACATKVAPLHAGEPHPQAVQFDEVPRHVDAVMLALKSELLLPARERLRAAPVSTSGPASDGSYTRWLSEVSEALVAGRPLSNNLDRMSQRAARDLARIAARDKKTDPPPPDLSLLARQINVHFEKQSAEVRRTAAAYFESAFSLPG